MNKNNPIMENFVKYKWAVAEAKKKQQIVIT